MLQNNVMHSHRPVVFLKINFLLLSPLFFMWLLKEWKELSGWIMIKYVEQKKNSLSHLQKNLLTSRLYNVYGTTATRPCSHTINVKSLFHPSSDCVCRSHPSIIIFLIKKGGIHSLFSFCKKRKKGEEEKLTWVCVLPYFTVLSSH